MGRFRTRGGCCVVEHGEMNLESLGFRGRFERGYENAKLAHKQRYERGVLRFWFVLLLGIYGIGQFSYEVVFGDEQLALLGVAIVVGVLGVIYCYVLLRRLIRRWFRGFTDERTIPVRAIESVAPRQKRLFRQPHFVVHYDEYGTKKKRYIGVCALTPLAEDEFETAKAILFDENDLPITAP